MVGDGAGQAGSGVTIVRVADQHAAVLAEFYRGVWDPTATPESVRRSRSAAAAANPVVPGAEIPTFLFLQSNRALGHVTTIPVRLHACGVERPGHWVKGLMVVPEHRNGPVGMLLLKDAVKQLDLAMAMVVQAAPRRLFQALGFQDLGAMPNYLRLLRPGRVLSRLDVQQLPVGRAIGSVIRLAQRSGIAGAAGAAGGAVIRAWAGITGHAPAGLTIGVDQALDEQALDALWQRARASIPAGPSRDGRMLRWRYASADGPYRFVAVREGSALVGVAVVRTPRADADPRLAGLRVATLSDVVFPLDRADVGLAALAGAEQVARDLDADALLCSASHRLLGRLLRRRAFVRVGANVHFMIRDPDPRRAFPASLEEWWLTRGDSSADEVF